MDHSCRCGWQGVLGEGQARCAGVLVAGEWDFDGGHQLTGPESVSQCSDMTQEIECFESIV